MILNYQYTNTNHISSELNRLRGEGGVVVLGRVLTLVIVTQKGREDEAVKTAIAASWEHPCRIIVLAPETDGSASAETRMDTQIRLGSDSGTGEVIIIYGSGELKEPTESLISALILPDIPIVVWWHTGIPDEVAATSLGMIAHRRITDTSRCIDTTSALNILSRTYAKGNTDIAWTRTTHWRAQLVAALDQTQDPRSVKSITVEGGPNSASSLLLASWLYQKLEAPLTLVENPTHPGIHGVTLSLREGAAVELYRVDDKQVALAQPGHPVQHLSLSSRTLEDCLAEDLRHLDEDRVYGSVITQGIPKTFASMAIKHI